MGSDRVHNALRGKRDRCRVLDLAPRKEGSDMADKIRLGLVGASVRGTWSSRSHLPALRASSDLELTAVCTTRADSAEAARQAWGARLAFDDYHKMVASPQIDA